MKPDKGGIYALGVTPWTEDRSSDASLPFFTWAGAIQLDGDAEFGYPGVFVPNSDLVYPEDLADARMEQIAAALDSQDSAALTALFSARGLRDAVGFERGLEAIFSLLAGRSLTWERLGVNSSGDEAEMLAARYRVSVDGEDYWLFFADFGVNTSDPENVGLASLAVTRWFEPGGSDQDDAFIEWTSSWSFDEGSAGIYASAN